MVEPSGGPSSKIGPLGASVSTGVSLESPVSSGELTGSPLGDSIKGPACESLDIGDFSGRGFDLRSTEKNIQLYHQLSGRAGRFSSESLIVYQTLSPENITLNDLIKNNPDEILKKELISRKENSLPPFCRLISIIISANNQSLSIEGAREIKTRLNKINGLEIMGPVDSPLLKIKKKFRSRLLIRFNEKSLKQKMVSNLLNSLKISSKIKLTVDVDPVNFG